MLLDLVGVKYQGSVSVRGGLWTLEVPGLLQVELTLLVEGI